MKTTLKLLCTALLGFTWTGILIAGNQTYNMDTDPATLTNADGTLAFTWAGTQAPGAASPNNVVPGNNGYWVSTGGNPSSGGYLDLTDAANNESLACIFPDVDNGLPIKGFQIDMDLRVGNGSAAPADGFSICFARLGDPAITNAQNGVIANWAGGDGSLATAQNPAGSIDVENGTMTGLAIVFDASQGNWLPDPGLPLNSSGSNDKEGLTIRVDNVTLTQVGLTNRNASCSVVQTNLALLSLQTGATNTSGTPTNLCWQHLQVRLTPTPSNSLLTVNWKGFNVVTNFPLTNYAATAGRLVLAARTGGRNEFQQADNIQIQTTPVTNSYLQSLQGALNGCTFTLSDVLSSIVTNVSLVTIDGTNENAFLTVNNGAPLHVGTISLPGRLASASRHTLGVTWQDSLGSNYVASLQFSVPVYAALSTNYLISATAVDTNQAGFLVSSYQSLAVNPTSLPWTEEQVIGVRGVNFADQGTAAVAGEAPYGGGFYEYQGAAGFYTQDNTVNYGQFTPQDLPFETFGFGAPALTGLSTLAQPHDSSTLEMFAYVYFPTSGVYTMIVGADDSYQLSTSQNPFDRMGQVVSSRGSSHVESPAGPPLGDLLNLAVDQPGYYPMRMLFENTTGPGELEWYFFYPPSTYLLVNDTNSPVKAFRASTANGPYVKKADPVRGAQDVLYFQPVVVDLGDGSTNSLGGSTAVNTNTVTLIVDGATNVVAVNQPSAGTTHIVQQPSSVWSNNWTVANHTIILNFQDRSGTNYSYTWPFTVMNVTNGVLLNGISNALITTTVPASFRVDPATLDLTQPGFRVAAAQTARINPSAVNGAPGVGHGIEQLEGLAGANLANLSGTNGPGFFTWANALDFSYVSTGARQGEWPYDYSYLDFGTFSFASPNQPNNSAWDISTWLVFPQAGTYAMHVNSDDGFIALMPYANYANNKAGMVVSLCDKALGPGGPSAGLVGGGDFFILNIPQAGAYPVHVFYFNAGGGASLEWSCYTPQPDGTFASLLINDPNQPGAIKAYQVSSADSGPFVDYVNPVPLAADTVPFQPTAVSLVDGPVRTVNQTNIALTSDGAGQTITVTKIGSTNHVLQQLTQPWRANVAHTNVLTYTDSLGTSYTNSWIFYVVNFNSGSGGFEPVQVPLSAMIPTNLIDFTQPGFHVLSYETADTGIGHNPGGGGGNNAWTEDQFQGLHGPNIITANTNVIYNSPWDVNQNAGSGGEWFYDTSQSLNWTTFFGAVAGNPSASSLNDFAVIIGTYMIFPQAGIYTMSVNSDDGFKVLVPDGINALQESGTILSAFDGTRGGGGPPGQASAPYTMPGTWFNFKIPAPGAYPIRMLFENVGGGCMFEWNLWNYLPDGSLARTLVGESAAPAAIPCYAALTTNAPYVAYVSPQSGQGPQPGLISGNGLETTILYPGLSVQPNGVVQDIVIALNDGSCPVNTNTVVLSFNGIVQPITISYSNGVTTIVRSSSATPFLPPGTYGQLTVTYRDNCGGSFTNVALNAFTGFWGTLTNGYALTSVNTNKPGFLARTYQVDPGTATTPPMPGRTHVAEQVLAGIWGPNSANTAAATNRLRINGPGYFALIGSGPSNGVVNFNAPSGQGGDFQAGNGYPDSLFPGIPGIGTVSQRSSNFVCEILSYVSFPSNGTYVLGISSDDGFRVTQGWNPPTNVAALRVNSPGNVAGLKPAVMSSITSTEVTNPITGNLVLANGIGFGSTTNGEGCVISNPSQIAGNIALMYRSSSCGAAQQVANAYAAGARAVVLVQSVPPGGGVFPDQVGINPAQPIPAVVIKKSDGDALLGVMSSNTVNVTLTTLDGFMDPNPANSPLGESDTARGATDVWFPVVVPEAGAYPLRLVYYQAGGGGACEFFSLVGTNRVLINDYTSTNGTALRAYSALNLGVSIASSNGNLVVTYSGTLQSSPDLVNWTDVPGSSPLIVPLIPSAPQTFYRAVVHPQP